MILSISFGDSRSQYDDDFRSCQRSRSDIEFRNTASSRTVSFGILINPKFGVLAKITRVEEEEEEEEEEELGTDTICRPASQR